MAGDWQEATIGYLQSMVELNLEQPETNPEQRLERDINGLCLSCAV